MIQKNLKYSFILVLITILSSCDDNSTSLRVDSNFELIDANSACYVNPNMRMENEVWSQEGAEFLKSNANFDMIIHQNAYQSWDMTNPDEDSLDLITKAVFSSKFCYKDPIIVNAELVPLGQYSDPIYRFDKSLSFSGLRNESFISFGNFQEPIKFESIPLIERTGFRDTDSIFHKGLELEWNEEVESARVNFWFSIRDIEDFSKERNVRLNIDTIVYDNKVKFDKKLFENIDLDSNEYFDVDLFIRSTKTRVIDYYGYDVAVIQVSDYWSANVYYLN